MKISKLSRRRQAARVYKVWSVKFLAQLFPQEYRRTGRSGMKRVITSCIESGVCGGEAYVWYDRNFCENGRKLALTQHIVRRLK